MTPPPRLAQPIRMSCVLNAPRNHNSIVSKIVLIRERCDLKKKKNRRLLRNRNNAGFAWPSLRCGVRSYTSIDRQRQTQKNALITNYPTNLYLHYAPRRCRCTQSVSVAKSFSFMKESNKNINIFINVLFQQIQTTRTHTFVHKKIKLVLVARAHRRTQQSRSRQTHIKI